MLIAIPFTRLSHMLSFWLTRAHTGSEFVYSAIQRIIRGCRNDQMERKTVADPGFDETIKNLTPEKITGPLITCSEKKLPRA